MILEVVDILIHPGQQSAFDAAIERGLQEVISRASGFRSFQVHKGIESPERYLLHIYWNTLEDHTERFRQSEAFAQWRAIVGPFFARPPLVEHFDAVCASPSTGYVMTAPAKPSLAVVGLHERFPVRRIYCVGRNYLEHALEMGYSEREAPFFFMKPADAVVPAEPGQAVSMPYPSLTHDLHHEVELVVAIGKGGRNITAADAAQHIYGYAVGLDMTRRDLQATLKKQGRPWCVSKGFDHAAPIGPLTPAAQAPGVHEATIHLSVNGQQRQHSVTSKMIWSIAETIEQLSQAWALEPGDLIYTGTPENVGAVQRGDVLDASISGLEPLRVHIS